MDQLADDFVLCHVATLSQRFWASEEEIVHNLAATLAKPALVIWWNFEVFLEPIREETFFLCGMSIHLIVAVQDSTY